MSPRPKTFSGAVLIVIISSILTMSACGGGGGGQVTPPPPSPSFSISTSPSTSQSSPMAITMGSAGTEASVSIVGQNGFSGSVNVSLNGVPTGVTAAPISWSTPAGQSQKVVFTANANAAVSTFQVTVSGSSGALTSSATLNGKVILPPNSAVVTSAATTISVSDSTDPLSGLKIEIPAGALDDPVLISWAGVDPAGIPPGLLATKKIVQFSPDGLTFKAPVAITFPYPDANNDGYIDDTGVEENTVEVYSVSGSSSELEYLNPLARDPGGNRIKAEVMHFSRFVLVRFFPFSNTDAVYYFIDPNMLANALSLPFPTTESRLSRPAVVAAVRRAMAAWQEQIRCKLQIINVNDVDPTVDTAVKFFNFLAAHGDTFSSPSGISDNGLIVTSNAKLSGTGQTTWVFTNFGDQQVGIRQIEVSDSTGMYGTLDNPGVVWRTRYDEVTTQQSTHTSQLLSNGKSVTLLDLQTILAHEGGHAFGLSHIPESTECFVFNLLPDLINGGLIDSHCAMFPLMHPNPRARISTRTLLGHKELFGDIAAIRKQYGLPETGCPRVAQQAGTMNVARAGHTATVISNGRVLIAGGYSVDNNTPTGSVEIYDPLSGTFTPTGSMNIPRWGHSAILLNASKVLIVGGNTACCSPNYVAQAEVYDPASGSFQLVGSLPQGRGGAASSDVPLLKLSDGSVLVVDGYTPSDCGIPTSDIQRFDPATGLFAHFGNTILAHGGPTWTTTFLRNGKVLAAGALGDCHNPNPPPPYAEIWDPTTRTSTTQFGQPSKNRTPFAGETLQDGRYFTIAAEAATGTNAIVEFFDPDPDDNLSTNDAAVVDTNDTNFQGGGLRSSILSDGRVLVSGNTNSPAVAIYDPATTKSAAVSPQEPLRRGHTSTWIYGNVLLAGGITPSGPTASAELITLAGNAGPSISSLSPYTVLAASNGFTLTVNGMGFMSSSVVWWNGTARTTTFVSSTVLKAEILTADVAAVGSAKVAVLNPSPGGGIATATFYIGGLPHLDSISPSSGTAGGSAFELTVKGGNFMSNSIVRWNGSSRSTTYYSMTHLGAQISALDIANSGTATVTVYNPYPGATSNGMTFTITGGGGVPTYTVKTISVPWDGDVMGMAAGKFNADSYADLATTEPLFQMVHTVFGNAQGDFGSLFDVSLIANSIASADLNGDGRAEMVVGGVNGFGGQYVGVYAGDTQGHFSTNPIWQDPISLTCAPVGVQSIALADLNKDGKLDIVAGHSGFSVYLGNGSGQFAKQGTDHGCDPNDMYEAKAVLAGDFSGDGNQDVAVLDALNNQTTLWLGNGTGTFTSLSPVSGQFWAALPNGRVPAVAADFDKDGYTDIAVRATAATVKVYFGAATGAFSTSKTITSPNMNPSDSVASVIAAGDFDNDGQPDIVFTGPADPTKYEVWTVLDIFYSRVGRAFVSGPFSGVPLDFGSYAIVVTDINNDDRPDVAVAGQGVLVELLSQ